MTNLKEIMTALQKAYNNGYTCFGVRKGVEAQVGQELECSHDWDHERDCSSEELLNGTCATGFGYLWFDGEKEDEDEVREMIEYNEDYPGEMQYIIAGYDYDYGEDEYEIVIKSAVVIAIVK